MSKHMYDFIGWLVIGFVTGASITALVMGLTPVTSEPVSILEPAVLINETFTTVDGESHDIEAELAADELEWLALAIMAEAGNQDELGKRLVCDVILNRVDHEKFPDTIHDVIFQKNQFAVVGNGSIYKVEPTDDIYGIVTEELQHRTNAEVMFFRTGKFSSYGEPWEKIGDHYFSKMKGE